MDNDGELTLVLVAAIAISVLVGFFFNKFFISLFEPSNYTSFIFVFAFFMAVGAIILFYKVEYGYSLRKKRTAVNPITSFDQIIMVIVAILSFWGFSILGTMGAAFYSGMTADDSTSTIGSNVPSTLYPISTTSITSTNMPNQWQNQQPPSQKPCSIVGTWNDWMGQKDEVVNFYEDGSGKSITPKRLHQAVWVARSDGKYIIRWADGAVDTVEVIECNYLDGSNNYGGHIFAHRA